MLSGPPISAHVVISAHPNPEPRARKHLKASCRMKKTMDFLNLGVTGRFIAKARLAKSIEFERFRRSDTGD